MLGGLILQLLERFDNPDNTKLPSVEAFDVSPKCADVEQEWLTVSKN